MKKMKMHSPNVSQDNIARIRELFPGCVTEVRGKNKQLKLAVDFDLLRQELNEVIVEGEQEKYHLNWPGKREALLTANAPIAKTLRPCRKESVNFDTTKNLFIEGDNLEALKLLQETYLGKVKMIYIDPPYNTGNDFIYKDDFTENSDLFLKRSNQKDEQGNRLLANTESNGRFHSDWLSMMDPRLRLAKRLLSEDGLIFISIGQEEVLNLRKIMDEIFGEENYRNMIAIKRGAKSVQAQFNTWDKLGTAFEYLLLYSKSETFRFPKQMRNLDEERDGTWNNHWRGTDRPSMRYELFGIKPKTGQWRWSKERSFAAIENYNKMINEIRKKTKEVTQRDIDEWYLKLDDEIDLLRLSSSQKPEHYVPPTNETLLNDVWFHLSLNGSASIKNIFKKKYFDNPKSINLISQILDFVPSDSLVLDFFAGSSTTAHAILQKNAEDGGNRKFIMIQLPEECDKKSEAFKDGFITISEISKERIRRAGKEILNGDCNDNWDQDVGFRVLKIDTSNMAEVYYTPDTLEKKQLKLFTNNIKQDRNAEDLLFQVLLDWGKDLSLSIRKEKIQGKSVFFVDENALIACFDTDLNEALFKKMAKFEPQGVVFCDSGFKSDSIKINVGQIFKQLSPRTELKTI